MFSLRSLITPCRTLRHVPAITFSLIASLFAGNLSATEDLSFSVIVTAESAGTQEAMVVDGGRWLTQRKLVHTAVLVKHPKGDFLWDSGIGTELEQQMESFSFWQKALFKVENVNPAVHQFAKHGYDANKLKAIIPSHMHWDHVSAIEDFIGTPVWVQKQEHTSALNGQVPAFVQSQFDSADLTWQFISLAQVPYETFEKSLDIYGDGSVILVDLSGHTQGQLGMFLNMNEKGRYLFIGDTTWTINGVTQNKGRPSFVQWLTKVDNNQEKNDLLVDKIHTLTNTYPDLVVVPAHDENVNGELPRYPDFL